MTYFLSIYSYSMFLNNQLVPVISYAMAAIINYSLSLVFYYYYYSNAA